MHEGNLIRTAVQIRPSPPYIIAPKGAFIMYGGDGEKANCLRYRQQIGWSYFHFAFQNKAELKQLRHYWMHEHKTLKITML